MIARDVAQISPWQCGTWGTSQSGTGASCVCTGAAHHKRSPCQSPACAACRWEIDPPLRCSSCLCWCRTRSWADGTALYNGQSDEENKTLCLSISLILVSYTNMLKFPWQLAEISLNILPPLIILFQVTNMFLVLVSIPPLNYKSRLHYFK